MVDYRGRIIEVLDYRGVRLWSDSQHTLIVLSVLQNVMVRLKGMSDVRGVGLQSFPF